MIGLAVMILATGAVLLAWPRPLVGVPWRSICVGIAGGVAGAVIAAAVVGTPVVIAMAGLAGTWAPVVRRRRGDARRQAMVRAQWPDAIDVVRSGVRAGATVASAVGQAAPRVPPQLQPRFRDVAARLAVGDSFAAAVPELAAPDDPVGRRVVACLALSDEVGSADTGRVLAALADFIRSDVAQQREIAARHSWNVAAARIAVVAPWLTVAALSVQPTARAAYSTATGTVLLAVVAALTAVAYGAMNRVGRARPSGLVDR